MMSDKKVFDLSARRDPVAARVQLEPEGESYAVLKPNGFQYERIGQLTDESPMTDLYALAKEFIPSAPSDSIMRLNRDEVKQIILLAGQGIEAVQALFPNGSSPEPPTSPG